MVAAAYDRLQIDAARGAAAPKRRSTSANDCERWNRSHSVKIGVVGGGIFGIAAALELRARGHTVAVFEQGTVPYEKATSTDVSKAIRRSWYAGDNETYVELVERAARQWRSWETRSGTTVYHQTGGLTILPSLNPGSPMYESWRFL